MIGRDELVSHLNELLGIDAVRDGCPNGLQVEGRERIEAVALGVTSSLAFIEKAVELGVDAAIVHHGLFWRSPAEMRVVRSMRARLRRILGAELNLLAYHLPLDRHVGLGNGAVLARTIGAEHLAPAFEYEGASVGVEARFAAPVSAEEVFQRIARAVGRDPLIVAGGPPEVGRVGVVTGAGQRLLEDAVRMGLDLFLTGEANEPAAHIAREEGIHFVAAGHHATERFGVMALAEYLRDTFGLEAEFIDIGNPA